MALDFETAVEGIPSIRGIFVATMPDCLLFDSWMREGENWEAEEVAAYVGDLVRSNRGGLRALSALSADLQVTVESTDTQLVIRELRNGDFAMGFVFDRQAPLGVVRLHVGRMLDEIRPQLPAPSPQERPRGVRVIEFLRRYAPDPGEALRNVSQRTGIPLATLDTPENLHEFQLESLEEAVRDVLGMEQLDL